VTVISGGITISLNVSVLGSSSKGNSTLVHSSDSALLFDAGLPIRYIIDNLRDLDVAPSSIRGILVSHEHRDHIRSVAKMSQRFAIPVYISETTYDLARGLLDGSHEIIYIEPLERFSIGDFDIMPFPVPHDAAETLGFRIEKGGRSMAMATDIGQLTPLVMDHMKGCTAIVLESNYDREMLMNGPYPPFLKQSIISQMGHFSNEDCLNALKNIVTKDTKYVVLAHLSEENNDPYVALKTVNDGLGQKKVNVMVAYPRKRADSCVL
jgi:phosphoribosyl 1,2-cyclic phosphodiesterase